MPITCAIFELQATYAHWSVQLSLPRSPLNLQLQIVGYRGNSLTKQKEDANVFNSLPHQKYVEAADLADVQLVFLHFAIVLPHSIACLCEFSDEQDLVSLQGSRFLSSSARVRPFIFKSSRHECDVVAGAAPSAEGNSGG